MDSQAEVADGLPDLPPLPTGWRYELLGALVDESRGISYGVVQPGSSTENGVPIVRVNNIRDGRLTTDDVLFVGQDVEAQYKRTRLRGGEVLLSLVGTLGEVATVPPSLAGWNTARAVAVIPVLADPGPLWVNLSLRSPLVRHFINVWATTTVQATLNLRDVARLPVPLPPAHERAAISQTLGALDDRIELNRRMNETLEGIAATLFNSSFVNFHAQYSAASNMSANQEGKPPISYPENSGAEQGLPPGWRLERLGFVMINQRRGVEPSAMDPDTPYIGLEHMPRNSIALSEWGRAAEVESTKLQFRRGEILFGKLRPYFHKVGVAVVDGVASADVVVISATPEWFGFVLGHVSSNRFVDAVNAGSTGTKMPRASWVDMANYPVALPPVALASKYSALVEPMLDRIRSNIFESRILSELRDTLLPKLLSGAVRVREAESLMEAAV